jgi:hypothetical protein
LLNIKKISSDGNTLTISSNGKNIDGAASQTTTAQYKNFQLYYDGITWNVLSAL